MKTIFSGLILMLAAVLTAEDSVMDTALAGSWFPADGKLLRAQIRGFVDKATGEKEYDQVIALVLPHAGYSYSGPVAGYGIAQLLNKSYRRVVILGPSHRVALRNKIAVCENERWRTPLGETPLDTAAVKTLLQYDFTVSSGAVLAGEHSVQIELPLLQYALKDFMVVPVVVGQLDNEGVEAIAAALRQIIDAQTLLVVSSDFTHYGDRFGYTPFGNGNDVKDRIAALDAGAVKRIIAHDRMGFDRYMRQTEATICGECPIRLLLALLPKDAVVHELKYDTSGAITGDFANSVSYVALAATGSWSSPPEVPAERNGFTPEEHQAMLKLARDSIKYFLREGRVPDARKLDFKPSAKMKEKRGVFVTLHEGGKLRGCIGEIMPRRPLYEAVIAQAVNAAVRDPRFSPVTAEEVKDLDIEISVLTPPEKVKSWKDIVAGRDGVILSRSFYSAVFLPQVATEQGWNVEQLLSHLAVKAGMEPDDWREGATFQVFQAEVFHEKEAEK